MYDSYNKETEKKILAYWESKNILQKTIDQNKNGEDFFFLQGPPYTSGKIHCGQAWNHSLKDAVLRFKRMQGKNVLARAGYDMHGLPTELKVQKQLNLNGKEDIEKYGYEKFIQECIKWSEEKSSVMSKDLENLGITLDFSDPYKPISQDYIDSIWYLIKQADKKQRLYLGEKTMLWDAATESALAKHEVEYKEVKDNSIFLKFQKEGKDNEYFVIWTTTPWTIPFNLAIMVNPEMEYVDAKVKTDGKEEVWTVCKDLSGIFLGNVDDIEYEIIHTYLGEKLEGQKYIHPWAKHNPDLQDIDAEKLFTVLLSSEYVDSSAGTGLVHCAPGCGPEDYEVGLRNGLPPYNVINEKGQFPDRLEKYAGLVAKEDDIEFIKMMKEDGFLIKKTPIEHEYPHGERSGKPVIFRTTKQWFFKVEDLKPRMLEFNKEVNWHPQTAKNAFNSWLDNLRDNSITKQRFWGTPAPIWASFDEEGKLQEYYVVESHDELQKLATSELPKDLHKPWIDSVEITHPESGNVLKRIPDVLDVWIDAGCASWASLYYPKNPEQFEKFFPADYIVEGKDQIRGWFNLLMIAGVLAFDKPVFKNVSMHGFISGVDGVKMSKSLGNIITPEEVIEKSSIDTFRLYFTQNKAGEDIAFSWENLSLAQRQLTILWNTAKYIKDTLGSKKLADTLANGKANLGLEEQYILSKTHSTINQVSTLYEHYKVDEVPEKIVDLFLSISRDYIQAVREKENKDVVIYTLYEAIMKTITILAPVCPFITEMIYQNMKEIDSSLDKESVHMLDWPEADTSLINKDLETNFNSALDIISGILATREKAKINVRQPLAKSIIVSKDAGSTIAQFESMIKSQTNVKILDVVEQFDKVSYSVKANFKNLGSDFGQKTADIGKAINALSKDDIMKMHESFAVNKPFCMNGEEIKSHHVTFETLVEEPYVHADMSNGFIATDTTLTDELKAEGLSREFTRRVQNARKEAGLVKEDVVLLKLNNQEFFSVIEPYIENVKKVCGLKEITITDNSGEEIELKGHKVKISLD